MRSIRDSSQPLAPECLLGRSCCGPPELGLALGKQARLEEGLRPSSMAIGCLPEQESMGLAAVAEGKRLSASVKKHFEAHVCAPFSLRRKYKTTFPFHGHVKAPCFVS